MANIKTKPVEGEELEEREERKSNKSILSQISDVQHSLQKHYYRVEVLEKALAFKDMTSDERDVMEAELAAIKQLLTRNEDALKQLQKENRKTVSVAGLLIFICVGIFCLYTLVTNPL